MAFKKLSDTQLRPARRWALVGFPGDGKSSFGAQMQAPLLPIDIDGRFMEVAHLASGEVLALSEEHADNNDVQAIDRLLSENMPDSGVRTILVDSVTPLFHRITRRNQVAEHEGDLTGNKSAVHREKADVMALLGTAVSSYGTDTLWIWHLNESQFNGGKKVGQSLSNIERERLQKYLNAELHVVIDKEGRRGVQIAWARSGHGIGQIVWDSQENFDSGFFWKGVPEKVEALLYPKNAPKAAPVGGNSTPQTGATESANSSATTSTTAGTASNDNASSTARSFASSDEAIQWGVTELQLSVEEVTEAYNTVKANTKPSKASIMWAAWVVEVETRKAAVEAKRF